MATKEGEPKVEVKEMPDKETLEAFIGGMMGEVRVSFNKETGRFEWIESRGNEKDKINEG